MTGQSLNGVMQQGVDAIKWTMTALTQDPKGQSSCNSKELTPMQERVAMVAKVAMALSVAFVAGNLIAATMFLPPMALLTFAGLAKLLMITHIGVASFQTMKGAYDHYSLTSPSTFGKGLCKSFIYNLLPGVSQYFNGGNRLGPNYYQ